MVVLVALAVICLALTVILRSKDPVREKTREPGPITWRGGRRALTEDEAARLVLERLRDRG